MISIVIPSYNSENTIRECLLSLQAQPPDEPWEIIVADSSEDRTAEIVQQEFPQVRLLRFERRTDPGSARNRAVRESSGDPVLFIDSDCRAADGWVQRMVSLHRERPEVDGVGGAALFGNDPASAVARAGYMAEFREFIPQQPARLVAHIPTLNVSYKRRVFARAGYFDPRFYPQEDLVFNHRLQEMGALLYFDPRIRVYHTHRTSLRSFCDHQQRIGEINARVLRHLPLPGALLARHRFLFLPAAPLLPLVKYVRTLAVFTRRAPGMLLGHPLTALVLALGMLCWLGGFAQGVFGDGGPPPGGSQDG